MAVEVEQEIEVIPATAMFDHLYSSAQLCDLVGVTRKNFYLRVYRARKNSQEPITPLINPINRRERLWSLKQVGRIFPPSSLRGRRR